MPRYLIAAFSLDRAKPPMYFAGWSDRGHEATAVCVTAWCAHRYGAIAFEARDEAETEARLLAPAYRSRTLRVEPAMTGEAR